MNEINFKKEQQSTENADLTIEIYKKKKSIGMSQKKKEMNNIFYI